MSPTLVVSHDHQVATESGKPYGSPVWKYDRHLATVPLYEQSEGGAKFRCCQELRQHLDWSKKTVETTTSFAVAEFAPRMRLSPIYPTYGLFYTFACKSAVKSSLISHYASRVWAGRRTCGCYNNSLA